MGIYVWGTGCGASELIEVGLEMERITAFLDSFPSGEQFLGKPVLLPEAMDIRDCDLLIVTTRHAESVAQRCIELNIPEERILFLKNAVTLHNRNASCKSAAVLLGEDLLKKLFPIQRVLPTPAQLSESLLPEGDLQNDYARLATLELLCRRLKTVPGAAAELGVYKGFFARCINQLLPDRRLYLFDSFAGFSPEACASESFQAAHENTAVEKVLSVMPYPEKVIIRSGFFPESLKGLEARFCLVSLDVDFMQTTLEGLRYFWPRLEKGGYLLLHDWGSTSLPGVANALAEYERELAEPIRAVPLCDISGTLVLCK